MNPRQIREFVRRARGGDEEAFGELVKIYHQRIYGLAFGMVNNVEDAKEIAQQVWIKVWKKLGGFKEDARFFTWVYRVTSNASLDFLRRRSRRKEDPLPDGVESFGDLQPERAASTVSRPDRQAQHDEVRAAFDEAVAELSPEHRMTITLREVEGMSYDQIAKVMKCRKGTVMSRVFYARRKLQERLRGLL